MSDIDELVKRLARYALRTGYDYQDGSQSQAPAIIFADADYAVGDGKCGLHETVKSANEPAIIYVRADTLTALKEENERLREALEDLRKNAALLKQNAEGCVVIHYAEDFAIQGMPGWLLDATASIEQRAHAALTGKGGGDG